MFDLVPVPVKNFIDAIFAPPLSFVGAMSDMLENAAIIAGRGLSLGNYFSFFGYLPASFQTVIQSALASVALLGVVWLVRSLWDAYMRVKGTVKWW